MEGQENKRFHDLIRFYKCERNHTIRKYTTQKWSGKCVNYCKTNSIKSSKEDQISVQSMDTSMVHKQISLVESKWGYRIDLLLFGWIQEIDIILFQQV